MIIMGNANFYTTTESNTFSNPIILPPLNLKQLHSPANNNHDNGKIPTLIPSVIFEPIYEINDNTIINPNLNSRAHARSSSSHKSNYETVNQRSNNLSDGFNSEHTTTRASSLSPNMLTSNGNREHPYNFVQNDSQQMDPSSGQKATSPLNQEPGLMPSVEAHQNFEKKKYQCDICQKFFTTLGHLARHARIHTGERKHKCPFPSCDSKFSRQDNCMQHYRTHLSGKRKRKVGTGVASAPAANSSASAGGK